MSTIRMELMHAEVPPNCSLGDFEIFCTQALQEQRAVMWWIGDIALALERQHPHTWHQAWPEWANPDLIARCKAVAAAYPPERRNLLASWSVHMQNAKRPDRVAAVQAIVDAGQTSDEARRNPPPVQHTPPAAEPPAAEPPANVVTPIVANPLPEPKMEVVEKTAESIDPSQWLLAVDISFYLHRTFSAGAGQDAAATFVGWIVRLLTRLSVKGLTDCVFCVDSTTSFRKQLTAEWETQYKTGREKDAEFVQQLQLAKHMLSQRNFALVEAPDMEADDIMASYAQTFPGRVTLLTYDKDLRQCLSEKTNILRDVTWEEDPATNNAVAKYEWITAKSHVEQGVAYGGCLVTGITPEQWPHFQAIAGDPSDSIRGCEGVGAKGAMDLIRAHGSIRGVLDACHEGTVKLPPKKRLAILENFAPVATTMLQLTTMRRDISVPMTTKLLPEQLNQ